MIFIILYGIPYRKVLVIKILSFKEVSHMKTKRW